jgi:hypothetical protein
MIFRILFFDLKRFWEIAADIFAVISQNLLNPSIITKKILKIIQISIILSQTNSEGIILYPAVASHRRWYLHSARLFYARDCLAQDYTYLDDFQDFIFFIF